MDSNLPVVTPSPTGQIVHVIHRSGYWWRVLLIALGLYVVGVAVFVLTENPNLFPTIIMLGSFMVPVTYVAFFYERRHLSRLNLPTISLSFLYGGLLGVFAASVLEPLFIQSLDIFTAFQVGLIEEFVKILGVLVIARRRGHDSELDGMILGAAAGMGFAALESMGYAFVAMIQSGGSLSLTVMVMLIRGLFSPLGHGTWTAILVGILFRESKNGQFRINRVVIVTFLTVVILHGLWDGLPSLVAFVTGSGLDVLISQSLIGLVGLFILWRKWREAVSTQLASTTFAMPAGADEAGFLPD